MLVSGTLALDHIAPVVAGFGPGELNGKLGAVRRQLGGCGMNLAYGLARSGCHPLPWVACGGDCPPEYLTSLTALGVDLSALAQQPTADCAAAYIFTRPDGSQLTGFYPGTAQLPAPDDRLRRQIAACSLWLAGPEDDQTLLRRLSVVPRGVPLWWLPGQYTEVLAAETLQQFLQRAHTLIVNETEWATLRGRLDGAAFGRLTELYVTGGDAGVRAGTPARLTHHPATATSPVDPTGCGDAFGAALAAARLQGRDVSEAVALGQDAARRCLVRHGTQTY